MDQLQKQQKLLPQYITKHLYQLKNHTCNKFYCIPLINNQLIIQIAVSSPITYTQRQCQQLFYIQFYIITTMNPSNSLRTPTKARSVPISEDLRFIVSQEKPKPFGLIDEFIHDTFENHLLFLSKQKEPQPEEQHISQSYPDPHSEESSSNHEHEEQEKFQTVKKQFERKLVQHEERHPTTARQNHKGCNCDKSKCQKNYCVCFKMGSTCSSDCECIGCQNHVITFEHLKNQKIALQLLSNSKQKGCNCKNSNCLKNYCICHQNGNKCSKMCKCENCHNMEERDKDGDEERDGVRLMFTARKRVKISEFECEENKENVRMNYY